MTNTIFELKQVIQNHFSIAASTLDERKPIVEYGLDSLAMIDLMFEIEEHFAIDLPDRAASADTLAALAEIIDTVLEHRHAA